MPYTMTSPLHKLRNRLGLGKTTALPLLVSIAGFLNLSAASFAQEPAKPAVEGYKDTPLLPGTPWHVHDPDRPQPTVVTPGTFSTASEPGKPPSDAIVLFDGKDLSQWRSANGGPAPWKIQDGTMTPSNGDIRTAQDFGDVQVHVEFAEPVPATGKGQGRGNSGIFLQGQYEFQVLDSYESSTYADGQAGALYGQRPPLVNASRPPGEWQVYDLVFTAARFKEGVLVTPAYVTAFHNGVLVQNHVAYLGPTGHRTLAHYAPLSLTGPLKLQDHHNAVRYRNIWVRPIHSVEADEEAAMAK